MQTNELIGLVVVGLVGCIMVAGFIPVLNETVDPDTTFTNDGYFHLNKINATDNATYTISWDADDSDILTVNGVDISVSSTNGGSFLQYSIFASETDMIRVGTTDGTGVTLAWVQIRGGQIAYATTSTLFNATIANGTLTATFGENDTRTATYTTAYIIDETGTGSYVMKKSNESAYMLADSIIYSVGFTHPAVYRVEGTIENVTVTNLQSGDTEVTISNEQIHKSVVSGYNGLYAFDNVTFDATISGVTTTNTYSYVIVPYEVTAEKTIHADSATASMIALLPLILIMGIVLMFVGAILVRRYV